MILFRHVIAQKIKIMGYLHDNVSLACMFCFPIRGHYRAFSHDVTAAILVFQNNETAAMLVY